MSEQLITLTLEIDNQEDGQSVEDLMKDLLAGRVSLRDLVSTTEYGFEITMMDAYNNQEAFAKLDTEDSEKILG